MKIAITGHRPNKLGNDYDLTSDLINKIKVKILEILNKHQNLTLITGMALGIDTLFALIAIECNLPFIAAIPCALQYEKWSNKHKERYLRILANPLCKQHFTSIEKYTPTCMQIRNEWMVDNCDLLIAVWDGSKGGTSNCVNYAKSRNKEIIIINPKDL